MDIASFHYQFKLSMDRIDTLSTEDFRKAEIDWLLNEAQLIKVKALFNGNNPKKEGFESSQKRIDDLSNLVIKYPLQPVIVPTLDSGVYEVSLSDLAFPYLHFIAGRVDVELTEDCIKSVALRFMQHDDYFKALADPFNSPGLEFMPFNFGRSSSGTSSIYIYPNDYTITGVYLEYLKYPNRMSFGNYTYIDGNVYPPQTSELPEHLHQEIVDLALQIAALNIENPDYIQLKNQKVFISD